MPSGCGSDWPSSGRGRDSPEFPSGRRASAGSVAGRQLDQNAPGELLDLFSDVSACVDSREILPQHERTERGLLIMWNGARAGWLDTSEIGVDGGRRIELTTAASPSAPTPLDFKDVHPDAVPHPLSIHVASRLADDDGDLAVEVDVVISTTRRPHMSDHIGSVRRLEGRDPIAPWRRRSRSRWTTARRDENRTHDSYIDAPCRAKPGLRRSLRPPCIRCAAVLLSRGRG